MKKYLEEFFEIYDYDKKDSAVLINTYQKISEDSKASDIWKKALSIYAENIDCDYAKILELADDVAFILDLNEFTVEFLIFICLSKRAEEIYKERGISSEIFHGNMLDLKYKLEECKLVYGIVGSFTCDWFAGFYNLTRFTLGRLQFEIKEFKDNCEIEGKMLTPETKVLSFHIPRSLKPLDEKSCDESFAMAKDFFKDKFEGEIPFYCRSWLLYPENKNILSEKSNVYRFMSRFTIVRTRIDKTLDNLWRLFDTKERNPDMLPENSSMQKAFKEHLKKGGKMGAGTGIFFL